MSVWRRWLAILGIAALAITAIAVAEIASLATEGQPHGKSQTHNQYQPAYALIVQLLLGGWNWLRTFLNHDTISALAIVVTAGFTGTLWWSTKGLWETTERHGRHLRRSSRAAIRAADAAKASSDAAIAIETASLFAFDLRMVIGFIESDPEFSSLQAFASIQNLGRTPAVVFQVSVDVVRTHVLPPRPNYASLNDITYGERVLDRGDRWDPPIAHFNERLSWSDVMDIAEGRQRIWLYGVVAYWDVLHRENRYGFCAEWHSLREGLAGFREITGRFIGAPPGRFIHMDVPQYSYRYHNPDPSDASRVPPILTAIPRGERAT